jgi:hypothetical protein
MLGFGDQMPDQGRADEAGSAGDKNAQNLLPQRSLASKVTPYRLRPN